MNNDLIQGAVRNLVSRGVVVVVIQYRLGMLGFFTTLTDDFPANLGMLDQVKSKILQPKVSLLDRGDAMGAELHWLVWR